MARPHSEHRHCWTDRQHRHVYHNKEEWNDIVLRPFIAPVRLFQAKALPGQWRMSRWNLPQIRSPSRDSNPGPIYLQSSALPLNHGRPPIIRKRRLCWAGHDGLPKIILRSELAMGQRPRGKLWLRYNDVLKCDLVAFGIAPTEWTQLADDRTEWRSGICRGTSISAKANRTFCHERRDRARIQFYRHTRQTIPWRWL